MATPKKQLGYDRKNLIDIDLISHVLLDDGWHEVSVNSQTGQSRFLLNEYRFTQAGCITDVAGEEATGSYYYCVINCEAKILAAGSSRSDNERVAQRLGE